jgi:hypothetical protein
MVSVLSVTRAFHQEPVPSLPVFSNRSSTDRADRNLCLARMSIRCSRIDVGLVASQCGGCTQRSIHHPHYNYRLASTVVMHTTTESDVTHEEYRRQITVTVHVRFGVGATDTVVFDVAE